ncbi:tRNA (adenosine(37)-N6)-threonylcarbamoyltransferase complex ATPase subunit type 1 TsaE [Spiroplasma alleghenense]|uniref:tRNA threonylcarbamoyladenosine biosynthesis protein TsaE n=1 Tax=Spiroplasma alleghenense TaxID=216931 RepID=A0A345Z2K8_9MOLU|nr:tRNA (adenosine(37)-N6)-threonylcarbamoyltransferase complex ATPase subunit type 1 TsaE [Spiroplasma alleghenense]AXK50837.1 tRNA threonylcarbamoyladenosine biosynthesis protein TsaE [Spiroplasma alleghenense]
MEIKKITDWDPIIEELDNFKNQEFFLLLTGDLGAGKTTFTKALLKKFGITQVVNSPTFVILNQYEIKNGLLNHMDAYRLDKTDDFELYEEQFENSFNVIEWPENLNLDFKNKLGWHLDIKFNQQGNREVRVIKNLKDFRGE